MSEPFEIIIHQTALEDISEAALWISENASKDKAVEWTEALHRRLETLSQMPTRCPLVPENGLWGEEELRQFLFDDYPSKCRVIFHISEKTVHILQVRHGSRRFLHEKD